MEYIVPFANDTHNNHLGNGSIKRLEQALLQYQEGKKFLLTTGLGRTFVKTDRPISLLMREWLLKRGVPEKDICLENVTHVCNTADEVYYVNNFLKKRHGKNEVKVILVSSYMHLPRICLLWNWHKTKYHMSTSGVNHFYSPLYEMTAFAQALWLRFFFNKTNAYCMRTKEV